MRIRFTQLLFFAFVLFTSCDQVSSVKAKPKLCDCQNYFYKDVEDAINFGKTEPSDRSKECEQYYTVEDLTNAKCGLTKYDPNFKAQ